MPQPVAALVLAAVLLAGGCKYFGDPLAAGRYAAAIEQFRAIVETDPQHAFALNNLASTYLKTRDARPASGAGLGARHNASVLDTLGVALTRRAGRGGLGSTSCLGSPCALANALC